MYACNETKERRYHKKLTRPLTMQPRRSQVNPTQPQTTKLKRSQTIVSTLQITEMEERFELTYIECRDISPNIIEYI